MAGFSPEDLYGGIDFGDIFRGQGFDFGFGGLDFVERFFGGRQRPTGPARGKNIEIEVEIPLAKVLSGGKHVLQITRRVICPTCQGSGAKTGTQLRSCNVCGGSGQQVITRSAGGLTLQQISICPACRGQGTVVAEFCPACDGRGTVEREEEISVTIPVGIEEGTVLRLSGTGGTSPEPGGLPGDLYVIVRTTPNPRFERRGPHLWHTETIEVPDAVLGTHLEIPTLDGQATVSIPPGTQPDTVLRLRGKGLPEFGGTGRGDLYLIVRLHVPETLAPEERQLYQQLRSGVRSPVLTDPPPVRSKVGQLWRSLFGRR
jgi:molecular chaperone DnaJ